MISGLHTASGSSSFPIIPSSPMLSESGIYCPCFSTWSTVRCQLSLLNVVPVRKRSACLHEYGRWKGKGYRDVTAGKIVEVSCGISEVDALRKRALPRYSGKGSRISMDFSLAAVSGSKAAVSNKLELWPAGRESEERDMLATMQGMSSVELEARYGGEGVSFGGRALRVATLRLANGSTARVVMEGARVTSWQMMMWHGAPEEILRAGFGPSGALEGGISASIARPPGDADLSIGDTGVAADCGGELMVPAEAPWGLLEASWDEDRTWARVVLGLELDAGGDTRSDGSARPISARIVVHLSASSLSYVLAFRNLHTESVALGASTAARLAISRAKGVTVNGLQGSLRRRLPAVEPELPTDADNDDDGAPEGEVPADDAWPRAIANLFGWRAPGGTAGSRPAGAESAGALMPGTRMTAEEESEEWAVEERDEVHGPLRREHRQLAGDVVMVDRGKRRSLSLVGLSLDAMTFQTSKPILGGPGDTDYLDVTFGTSTSEFVLGVAEEWVATVVLGNRNI